MAPSLSLWKCVWALLLACCMAQCVMGVLDAEELDALSKLLEIFPDLSHINTVDQDYGDSWVPGMAGLCDTDYTFDYHGLLCWGGHVRLLAFEDDANRMSPMASFPIVQALASTASFENLYLRWPAEAVDEWRILEGKSSIIGLTGSIPSVFNFSLLSNIATIFATSTSPVTWDLSPSKNTLTYLTLVSHVMSNEADMDLILKQTPLLSYFACYSCSWPLTSPNTVNITFPSSLSAVILADPQGASATATFLLSSLNPTFDYLKLYDFTSSKIELITMPHLNQLVINNCLDVPQNLMILDELTILSLLNIANRSWPIGYTDWATMSPATLSIDASFTSQDLINIFCTFGTPSFLTTLLISDPLSDQTLSLPACLSSFPNLSQFTLKGNQQFVASAFFTSLPTSLQRLSLGRALVTPLVFNVAWFSALTSLNNLDISNNLLSGTLPPDLFLQIPALSILRLTNNSLTGMVPFEGLSQAKEMHLDGNVFSSWPNITGTAPYLEKVVLDRNSLVEIPEDEILELLPSLQVFSIKNNQFLSGSVPSFWINLPQLRSIAIANCNLSGPFPSTFSTPELLELDFSGNQHISGSLPSKPTWHMKLNGNKFTGGIPATWASTDYAIESIELQNNQFDGTIPSNWISLFTSTRTSLIDLSNNPWDGPLFNLSRVTRSIVIRLQQTNFVFCSVFTDFNHIPVESWPSSANGECYFDEGDGCACPSAYTSCFNGLNCPAPSNPSTPPTASTCNGKVVPNGFVCNENGQLESPGPIVAPKLELPSSSGIVIISGDLILSSSITLNGAFTSIVVEGCIYAPDGLVIQFEQIDLDSKQQPSSAIPTDPQTLLTQRSNCTSSLITMKVQVNTPKSCKKVKLDSSLSSPSTLTVTFNLDTSSCNTKWIILGSVLGAVIIIAVIVTILVVKFNICGFRAKVLPYHGAN